MITIPDTPLIWIATRQKGQDLLQGDGVILGEYGSVRWSGKGKKCHYKHNPVQEILSMYES